MPGIVRVLSAFFRKQEVFKTFLQQRLEVHMVTALDFFDLA